MDKWMSQVCKSGRDKLGRWSYITIKGKKIGKSLLSQHTEYATTASRHQDQPRAGNSSGAN
eukprot:12942651-Ditylum_brightwellii.AAC.1